MLQATGLISLESAGVAIRTYRLMRRVSCTYSALIPVQQAYVLVPDWRLRLVLVVIDSLSAAPFCVPFGESDQILVLHNLCLLTLKTSRDVLWPNTVMSHLHHLPSLCITYIAGD